MRSKLIKLFPLLALLLLAPWPIAFAHDYVNASPQGGEIQIEVAESSARPSWQAFGKAIGGVSTTGDLFYVDATEYPTDILVTLYITNNNELNRCYSYLILRVGVYVEGNTDEWTAASLHDSQPVPDTFITMRNGQVSLTLPGCASYKFTIDGGSFRCTATNVDGGSVSPQFYLTTDQA